MIRWPHVGLAVLTLAIPVVAQDSATTVQAAPVNGVRHPVPFKVGERAEYNLKYGIIHAGVAVAEVVAIDSIRDRMAWHAVFRLRGGIPGFRINDRFDSWMDVITLASLRHWQDKDEGPYERELRYEIFPDRREYIEGKNAPQPSVDLPLDDGSFVFFLRTINLDSIGKVYEFNRYFRPDRNPVRIQVLRRERIRVPAGTFNTIVVKPIVKTRGVFAENGRAEVWLLDDSTHLMIQMKTHVKFGTLALYLRAFEHGTPSAAPPILDSTRRDTAKRDTTKPDSGAVR